MHELCFKGNYLKRFGRIKEFCNEQVEVVFDEVLKSFCDLWLEEEFVLQAGANAYERSGARSDIRAGHYSRWLITSRGRFKLSVPRGIEKRYDYTLFDKFKRRTDKFDEVLVSSILLGHSSRKAGRFFAKQFGHNTISHQTAMSSFKKFTEELMAWRKRPLRDNAVILVIDAVWLKGAIGYVKGARPVLFAYAIYPDGTEEVVDFEIARGESEAAYSRFCHRVYDRGLKNVRLVVRDDNSALRNMVATYWPEALDQQCVFHLIQNVAKRLDGQDDKKKILKLIQWLYEANGREEFYRRLKWFSSRYGQGREVPAIRYFLERVGNSIAYYNLPAKYWSIAKTTNRLERFFEELKRRIKVFRRFPNSGSCERWLYALTMEIKPDSLGITNSLKSQQSS